MVEARVLLVEWVLWAEAVWVRLDLVLGEELLLTAASVIRAAPVVEEVWASLVGEEELLARLVVEEELLTEPMVEDEMSAELVMWLEQGMWAEHVVTPGTVLEFEDAGVCTGCRS